MENSQGTRFVTAGFLLYSLGIIAAFVVGFSQPTLLRGLEFGLGTFAIVLVVSVLIAAVDLLRGRRIKHKESTNAECG